MPRFKKTDSGIGNIRHHEADYVLSHYDAWIIRYALDDYRRLLKRRIGSSDKFDFEERIHDVTYLHDFFKSALKEINKEYVDDNG